MQKIASVIYLCPFLAIRRRKKTFKQISKFYHEKFRESKNEWTPSSSSIFLMPPSDGVTIVPEIIKSNIKLKEIDNFILVAYKQQNH